MDIPTTSSSVRRVALVFLTGLLVAAAAGADNLRSAAGTVVATDAHSITLETADGSATFVRGDTTVVPRPIALGDQVVVRHAGDRTAVDVLRIDEDVDVTTTAYADRLAVRGRVIATGTTNLIVNTTSGEQAFVVNPQKLFPPLPTPDDHVAVIYRVQKEQGRDRLIATDLVVLPAPPAPVMVVAETEVAAPITVDVVTADTEVAEPLPAETLPAELLPAPPVRTVVIADAGLDADVDVAAEDAGAFAARNLTFEASSRLPQTATPLPLVALTGLLALGLTMGLRISR